MIVDKLGLNIPDYMDVNDYVFISFNIMKKSSIDTAALLWELILLHDNLEKYNKLSKDEYFWVPSNYVELNWKISDYKQRKCFKELEKMNLLKIWYKAGRRLRYIKLNISEIIEVLNNCGNEQKQTK